MVVSLALSKLGHVDQTKGGGAKEKMDMNSQFQFL